VKLFVEGIRQDFGDLPMNIGQTLSGAITAFWDCTNHPSLIIGLYALENM
jgi:hypothetical protein